MDELMKDYDSETDIPSDLSDIKDTCEFERRKFCVLKTIKSCFRFNLLNFNRSLKWAESEIVKVGTFFIEISVKFSR